MKLLVDTSAFIWATSEPHRLSAVAKVAITEPQNDRYVSLASLWEMQIKQHVGKLELDGKVQDRGPIWIKGIEAQLLPIELRHLGMLYKLPLYHRDPFDRMLIAQAISEGFTIVTPDKAIRQYDVPVIW